MHAALWLEAEIVRKKRVAMIGLDGQAFLTLF
jgi:hypothetical protein